MLKCAGLPCQPASELSGAKRVPRRPDQLIPNRYQKLIVNNITNSGSLFNTA